MVHNTQNDDYHGGPMPGPEVAKGQNKIVLLVMSALIFSAKVLLLVMSALIFFAVVLVFWDPLMRVERCKVRIPDANETLYFRSVAWGIGGGHWQVVLSPNRGILKKRAYDSDSEYFFYEPDGLLYRVNGKTLEIHVHGNYGPKPKNFSSKANVNIITYEYNPDWQKLLDNHEQMGLTEVSEWRG